VDTILPSAAVYISCALDIVSMEVDCMNFRYFDAAGNQLTIEQLKAMCIVTPTIEHIFATVVERIEKSWKQTDRLENDVPK
jgi:hypothetical protein